MKKPIKITLLSVGALLLVAVLFLVIKYSKFISAAKQLTPAETHAINDSVFCIKDGYVNAFIFKTSSGYIMIDAGMREGNVLEGMESFNISPDDVHTLLLTHSDGDHVGATGALKNAVVWLHKDEEEMIDGTTGKLGPPRKWKFGAYSLFDSDRVFEIDGLKIKVIHTPGHTPGSCCFVVNDIYLVTGDNLMMEGDKYAPFVEDFTMDPPLNAESIKNLPDPSEYEFVLTAHGGVWEKFREWQE